PALDSAESRQRRWEAAGAGSREVRAAAFPISIDTAAYEELAARPDVRARAYSEVLDEGKLGVPEAVLVLVASPSRERVEHYRLLRDEVEVAVGRINGKFGELGNTPGEELHQSYPPREMRR